MRWGGRQWTRSAAERTSSFRKLIRFYSLVREREREPTPRFPLCRVNECSHFVRCAATELNEIADEEEIGAAWNGKKDEAWRGSFTLPHRETSFLYSAKGGSARLNTNDHARSELSKVNASIEWLFISTSAVESEPCKWSCAQLWCILVIQFFRILYSPKRSHETGIKIDILLLITHF